MSRVMGRRETDWVAVGSCSPGEADKAFLKVSTHSVSSLPGSLLATQRLRVRPATPRTVTLGPGWRASP